MIKKTLLIALLLVFNGYPFSVFANPSEGPHLENRSLIENRVPHGCSLYGLEVTDISEEGILSLDGNLYMVSRRTKFYGHEYKPISMGDVHIGDIVDIEYMNAQDMEELSYKKGRVLLKLVIRPGTNR